MTFQQLKDDPEFARLPYSDQVIIRGKVLGKELGADPEFNALPDTDKVQIFNKAVYQMPAIEVKESDYLKSAQALVQRMEAGDKAAIGEAIGMSSNRVGTKQMLLPTLVARGADAIGKLFDPDVKDPLYADYYGRDGENIDQWLQMNIAKHGGKAAADQLAAASMAKGLVGGFAEFALMTLVSGGIGGAIGKGVATAGIAGPGTARIAAMGAQRGAALGSSIMTGNVFGQATNVALQGAGKYLSAPLVRNLLSLTVEGVTSGVTQTGLDMLRLGLQDELVNKTKSQVWDTIAQSYGTNIAMNYLGWGAVKAMGTVLGAAAKGIKGVKLDPVADYLKAFDVEANPAAKGTTRDYVLKVLGPQQAGVKLSTIDPKSEIGFQIYAQAHGWEAKFDASGKVQLTNIANPLIKTAPMARKQAVYKVGEAVATGKMSMPLEAPELITSLRGQAVATSNESRLLSKMTYDVKGQMAPEQLTQLLYPTEGVPNAANMQLFGRQYLMSQGVPEQVANRLRVDATSSAAGMGRQQTQGMNITVDAKVHRTGDEQLLVDVFMKDLDAVVKANKDPKAVSATPARFTPPPLEANHASFAAVEAAAQKLGIPAKIKGTTISLGDGPTVADFTSARDANANLIQRAFDMGMLTDDQIASMIGQRHGLTLEKVDASVMSTGGPAQRLAERRGGDPTLTTTKYVVYKPTPKGKVEVAAAKDLGTLFAEHPEFDVRLPSTLAPEVWSYDPLANQLTVESTVATGNVTQLIELAGKFTSPIAKKPLVTTAKGTVEQMPGTRTFVLRNDDLGAFAEFPSERSAMRYLKGADSKVRLLKDAFGIRDMRVQYGPDGSLIAIGADGSTQRFTSLVAAEKWLQSAPLADWMDELLPMPDTLINEANAQIGTAVDALAQSMAPRQRIMKPSKIVNAISHWGMPTEMALNVAKQQHGQNDLLKMFQRLRQGFRVVQGLDTKADAQINTLFKGIKYDDKVMYQVLLAADPSQWDSIADRGFKRTLTELDKTKLGELGDFYAAAFTAAGIPEWKRVLNYAPRIADYARRHGDDILESMTAGEYLKRVFGDVPNGFAFFGEKARATELLNLANFEDAEQVMRTYTYALNKHTVMDKMLKSMKGELLQLDGRFPKAELQLFQGAMDEMQSAAKTEQTKMFKGHSKQAILAIQGIMQKVPGLRGTRIANAPMVGDIIDLVHSQITVATQAKPWAVFRNMAQISLLGAAIGDNKVMWEAFKQVIMESDDATIKRLMKSGAVTGAGFITSAPGSKLSLWRAMMKWNENMDVITRATAFKAAENLLDVNWKALKAGTMDAPTFIKRSGLSILDDGLRGEVVNALHRGDLAFAADQYGDALNRLCFFDYSKVNRAAFQRGQVGKIYGKFGTFPAGTVALYHRILTSGDPAERVARASRMVLTSLAIYHGARMAGIDYKGFLWSDPMSFQGGPLWTLLQDGSQIVGDDPSAKQARASLWRNLPRLISPTVNTYMQISKAVERLNDGDVLGGALTLGGAPARKDAEWQASYR